jgi:hypothetical protein
MSSLVPGCSSRPLTGLLRVRDFRQARRGVPHLKVARKGEKTRYSSDQDLCPDAR